MKTRIVSLVLGLLAPSAIFAPGCDWPNHNLRQKDRDADVNHALATSVDSESTRILDVQEEPSKKKPFFKASRLSGGLSDEAREIERDFGIN